MQPLYLNAQRDLFLDYLKMYVIDVRVCTVTLPTLNKTQKVNKKHLYIPGVWPQNPTHKTTKYPDASNICPGLLLWKVRADGMDLVYAAFVKAEICKIICCLGPEYKASVLLVYTYRCNSTYSAQRDNMLMLRGDGTWLLWILLWISRVTRGWSQGCPCGRLAQKKGNGLYSSSIQLPAYATATSL